MRAGTVPLKSSLARVNITDQIMKYNRSLDFAVTRFLMKMFRTVNMDVINECRFYFDFMLPSELLVKRTSNCLRKFNSCSSIVCHFCFAKCVKCV